MLNLDLQFEFGFGTTIRFQSERAIRTQARRISIIVLREASGVHSWLPYAFGRLQPYPMADSAHVRWTKWIFGSRGAYNDTVGEYPAPCLHLPRAARTDVRGRCLRRWNLSTC